MRNFCRLVNTSFKHSRLIACFETGIQDSCGVQFHSWAAFFASCQNPSNKPQRDAHLLTPGLSQENDGVLLSGSLRCYAETDTWKFSQTLKRALWRFCLCSCSNAFKVTVWMQIGICSALMEPPPGYPKLSKTKIDCAISIVQTTPKYSTELSLIQGVSFVETNGLASLLGIFDGIWVHQGSFSMSHKEWSGRKQGRSERIIKRLVVAGNDFLLPLRIGEELALSGSLDIRVLRGGAEVWGSRLSNEFQRIVVPSWSPAPRLLAVRSANQVDSTESPEVQAFLAARTWPVVLSLRAHTPTVDPKEQLQQMKDILTSPVKPRLRAHRAWPSIVQHFVDHCLHNSSPQNPAVLLVMGAKGVGKSTCCRFLVNRLLSLQVPEVYFLETDLGQPELGPPGVVTLHRIRRPMLQVPHSEQHRHDRNWDLERFGYSRYFRCIFIIILVSFFPLILLSSFFGLMCSYFVPLYISSRLCSELWLVGCCAVRARFFLLILGRVFCCGWIATGCAKFRMDLEL